jgi:hypothetical protein
MPHGYDRREAAARGEFRWYDSLDLARMVAIVTITIYRHEGEGEAFEEWEEEEDREVAIRFDVCGTCDGRGSHVNPSIDADGISGEEWAHEWEEEDREAYLSGAYDVTCAECGGARVVPVPDPNRNPPELLALLAEREEERARDAWERAEERRWGA